MGGKKPLRRPLWPPTRATASNYYPLGLDGAGGAAKPLLRAPKKPAPLHGRLPAFSGAVDAFERARKCFLEWRYFFSIILSEFLKNRVALHPGRAGAAHRYVLVNSKKMCRIGICSQIVRSVVKMMGMPLGKNCGRWAIRMSDAWVPQKRLLVPPPGGKDDTGIFQTACRQEAIRKTGGMLFCQS